MPNIFDHESIELEDNAIILRDQDGRPRVLVRLEGDEPIAVLIGENGPMASIHVPRNNAPVSVSATLFDHDQNPKAGVVLTDDGEAIIARIVDGKPVAIDPDQPRRPGTLSGLN